MNGLEKMEARLLEVAKEMEGIRNESGSLFLEKQRIEASLDAVNKKMTRKDDEMYRLNVEYNELTNAISIVRKYESQGG